MSAIRAGADTRRRDAERGSQQTLRVSRSWAIAVGWRRHATTLAARADAELDAAHIGEGDVVAA